MDLTKTMRSAKEQLERASSEIAAEIQKLTPNYRLVILRKFNLLLCKTKTIHSNSERSEQLVVTECFFNLFLEVSHT
jgi:hypothetical protein